MKCQESLTFPLRAFYSHLRRSLPVKRGVALRVKSPLLLDGEACMGITHWSDSGRATIQLDPDFAVETLWSTFMHEYAHALSGDHTHGPYWADAHGKVYRAWEEWRDAE